MIPEAVKHFLCESEGQTLEFKLRPSEDIGRTLCAFANTNDGTILVGVSDSKDLVGTSLKMESQIASVAHSCKPSIFPEIKAVEVDGKTILVATVKMTGSIHSYKNIAYKRVGSHNQPLSPEELIELAKRTHRITFDDQVCQRVTLEDISEEKVHWFLMKAKAERNLDVDLQMPLKESLEKLGLTVDGELTHAAVLMFGKSPQKYFVQSEVRCARFKGTGAVKPFIDMKVIGGMVYEQIDQAEKFVLFNIKKAAWVEPGKVERQERWEYPPDAIREAITNAVAHRDYFSSANVQIRIFDDRIEVWNPGGLPEGWTVEKLKSKHESKPRNKLIARLFFLIKYIEQWGTGTNEMIKDCIAYGLPEPLFEDTGSSFIVTFRKSRFTEEVLEGLDLNDRQHRAISYVKERAKITNKIYREINNVGKVMAAAELNDLVAKGLLKIVGKGRSTKYVLNEY